MMISNRTTNGTGFPLDSNVNDFIACTFFTSSIIGILLLIINSCICGNRKDGRNVAFILVGTFSFLSLSTSQDEIIYFAVVASFLSIAIIYTLIGYFIFFTENEELPKEMHDSHLRPFILGITATVVVQECLYFIGSLCDKGNGRKSAIFILAAIQKLVQIGIYYFKLIDSVPKRQYGASLYYKIFALFNFIFWIESIKVTKNQQQEKFMEDMLHGLYTIFARTYTALIVDYRLICCILFVEHAAEINIMIARGESYERMEGNQSEQEQGVKVVHQCFNDYREFTRAIKNINGLGMTLGLVIVFLQILNMFVYFEGKESIVGPWGNIVGILAVLSIFIAGGFLLCQISSIDITEEGDHEDVGIDYLMVVMGLVSVMFWTANSISTIVWSIEGNATDQKQPYLVWTTGKVFFFPFVQLFQIYIFRKIRLCYAKNKTFLMMKKSYFLIPFLMLSSLALLANLIICEYRDYVEELIEEAHYVFVTEILLAVGAPMGIAFSCHIVLHFYTIYHQMRKCKHDFERQNRPVEPVEPVASVVRGLLDSDSAQNYTNA
eukprot:TCONS_00000847-protein